jgi:hypothetical protein
MRDVALQPGFRDFSECFRIYPHTLDEAAWADGFTEAEGS